MRVKCENNGKTCLAGIKWKIVSTYEPEQCSLMTDFCLAPHKGPSARAPNIHTIAPNIHPISPNIHPIAPNMHHIAPNIHTVDSVAWRHTRDRQLSRARRGQHYIGHSTVSRPDPPCTVTLYVPVPRGVEPSTLGHSRGA
eukprot:1192693-Prorocentrum_minimum.AAC.3